jgi:DNA-binding NtrC family response regulator
MDELPHVFHAKVAEDGDATCGTGFNWVELLHKTLPEVQRIVLDEVERRYLTQLLQKTRGRIDLTAQMAGIHPRGLYNKMKRYGLRKENFK